MPMPSGANWRGVAWNGTVFCAVAKTGTEAATSSDGITWTTRTLPASRAWEDIAWNGTVFCAIAGNTNKCATSPDGITWTEQTLPATRYWQRICSSNGQFVAIANSDSSFNPTTSAATSPDGITWTARAMPASEYWSTVASNGTTVVAIVESSNVIATSTDDGETWSAGTISATENWKDIAVTSSGFIAVASGTAVGAFSANGTSWSGITLPASRSWVRARWNGSVVVAINIDADDFCAIGNANGSSWSEDTMVDTAGYRPLAVNDSGLFLAIGNSTSTSAISADDGATWSTTPLYETGTATAPTYLYMAAVGAAEADTELTLAYPSGIASAQTRLAMIGEGTATAPSVLAMIGTAHVATWTARCILGGVDVSAQMVGSATVDAEEGAARVADITLKPPSGTIAPLDYVGQTITLDYVLVVGGVDVPRRIFTGRVDTPDYNPATTLLRLTCVDDLQNRVAALDRDVIDDLIGGRYSDAVQGEIDDNWDYAEALLSTVAASLDAGPHGGMRVTPWEIASVWATYDEGDLLYARAGLSLPQRSTLVNQVDIAFEYRYPRLRQRYTSIGWSGTQADMLKVGYQYPKQQDIAGAAGGSGWHVVTEVYWPAPAAIPHSSGGFIYPDEGSIDMAVLFLAQRHSQTVTESYTLTVTAPESIEANGELAHAIRGALASEFDGQAWESALDVLPAITGSGEMDYAPDATRTDSDYAIQTLLDQANVKILGSHRRARVSNAVLCNPDLDLDKRVAIDTAEVQADGKVARVRHVLDFAAGSAVTEFDLAIFGVGGAGILTPDSLDPPDEPDAATESQDWPSEVPELTVAIYGSTPYQDALMGLLLNPPATITVEDVPGEGTVTYDNPYYVAGSYPVTGFRVAMPGVDDDDRNPVNLPKAAIYQIIIPSDTLEFTIP